MIQSCVNALNGLLLISSPQEGDLEKLKEVLCQCPQRASTYFFVDQQNAAAAQAVSMPSTGFYLFLLLRIQRSAISTGCVNALNGLLLISSEYTAAINRGKKLCQCPQRASTYFFV